MWEKSTTSHQASSNSDNATMAERSEGKRKYEFTDNLNDITNLLEEMVEQDELLITRSSSNLIKCDSEQLDIQEETPAVSKFLNNLSNLCGMDKFINEKNCEIFNNLLNVVWTVNRSFLMICETKFSFYGRKSQ